MAIDLSRRLIASLLLVGAICLPATADSPETILTAFSVPASTEHVEQLPSAPSTALDSGPRAYQLSLEEAKCRTLQNSVLMEMTSSQLAAKCSALDAARKDFLPKLVNSFSYFHFDSDLGTVVQTPGIFNPATAVAIPVVEQDSTLFTSMAVQPITPLFKVKAAVHINEAEVGVAQAQKQLARRELTKGVEQLYIGLSFARKIKAGLDTAEAASQKLVDATHAASAKIGLVQVHQNLVTVNNQCIVLQTQLTQLVGLPPCTELHLEDLPAPQNPFFCADDVINAAVASSPKIREAKMQAEKAAGAVELAKAEKIPSLNAYGFYVNQNALPPIQEDFTGVGISASVMLEWGKRNDVLRQWQATEILARQNLQKEIQDLQLASIKAFNEVHRTEEALEYAQKLAQLERDSPLPEDPFQLKFAIKDRLESGIGEIKAELDYRNALVEVRSLAGYSGCE